MNVLNGNNSKLFPQTRLHRRAYKSLFIDNRNPCGDLIHNAKNLQGNQGNRQTRVLKVLLAFSCFFQVLRFWWFKTGFYFNIFCSLEKFWFILCNNLKMRKFSTNLTRNLLTGNIVMLKIFNTKYWNFLGFVIVRSVCSQWWDRIWDISFVFSGCEPYDE